MAFTVLGKNTSLGRAMALIRMRTGTLDVQESEIFDPQLVDVVHQAVLAAAAKLPKERYSTTVTSAASEIAEASNLIDISTLDIADQAKESMALIDATHGDIPIIDSSLFNSLKSHYTASALTNGLFARLTNIKATDNKLQIQTYRGSTVATPGALEFTFIRNPKYITTMTAMLDIPEDLIPFVIEVAVVAISPKAKVATA